jgi:hypothetical protein
MLATRVEQHKGGSTLLAMLDLSERACLWQICLLIVPRQETLSTLKFEGLRFVIR